MGRDFKWSVTVSCWDLNRNISGLTYHHNSEKYSKAKLKTKFCGKLMVKFHDKLQSVGQSLLIFIFLVID